MKNLILLLTVLLLAGTMYAQTHLEVLGKAVIQDMPKLNTADSVVVRLSDGTLGVRDVSSLTEYQILSIGNDTIYLSNGGYVVLPPGFDGQYSSLTGAPVNVSDFTNDAGYLTSEVDGSVTNELQTISRSGLTVSLSNGGGSYQDSITVYTAGTGIDITGTVISSSSPWCLGKDTLDGIVFYIYKGEDGQEHGLIVAKTESSAQQWQSTPSLLNANLSWDGVYNMNLMTSSPARTYVESLGIGWYLPSIDELSLLWQNRFHANKALYDGGFTLLSQTASVWSSTEFGASNALFLGFTGGGGSIAAKTSSAVVRAVRAF